MGIHMYLESPSVWQTSGDESYIMTDGKVNLNIIVIRGEAARS